ncbi:MAG: GNAT family N-acetyltransferase [Gemmatimonadota bacterium]
MARRVRRPVRADPAGSAAILTIRQIRADDNPRLAQIIRQVLTEFGAVGEGYSIVDPEVDDMCGSYSDGRAAYFVAEHDGVVVGGAGVAHLSGAEDDVCELRKMYVLQEGRGLGLGRRLLDTCLTAARELGFATCYLETLEHMTTARRLYDAYGFQPLASPLGHTGHFGCDNWYALDLGSDESI